MNRALMIVLEFARAENAGQPHAFRFTTQAYLMRTPGGGFESAEFPWSDTLLADLRALREVGRDPAVLQRVGTVLRDFLGPAGWAAHESAIVAAAQAGAAIEVTVRSAAAELYALPWELLALKSTGQMIGGIPGLVLRYEWPATKTCPDVVPSGSRRGRVLFAWSAAGGAVPAAEHLAALRRAFPGSFDPSRDVVAHASFPALAEALERAHQDGPPIDVLHFLCHGGPSGSTYGLALDDAGRPGERVLVDAGRLQQLIAPHAGMLRLVVLSACDSGNAGELGNHLGSVAQMLHRAGLGAVVASRFPLSRAGSSRLCEGLFGRLAAGATIEEAFIAARDLLLRDPDQLDWASVQLYGRAADGETRPLAVSVAAPVGPRGAASVTLTIAFGLILTVFVALGWWHFRDVNDAASDGSGTKAPDETVHAELSTHPPKRDLPVAIDTPDVPAEEPFTADPRSRVDTTAKSPPAVPIDKVRRSKGAKKMQDGEGAEESAPMAVTGENVKRALTRAPEFGEKLAECNSEFGELMKRSLLEGDYLINFSRSADATWAITIPEDKKGRSWNCFHRVLSDAMSGDHARWADGHTTLDAKDILRKVSSTP